MTTTTSTSSSSSPAATSAKQSLVTALGGGSGIDMAALAANLATAQFSSRVDRLATKSDTLNAQISAASNLKSMLLNLSTSLGDQVRTGSLSPQPQITDATVATATLSGTRPPQGSYSLEVTALAASQTQASAAYTAAAATVGSGTLTLRFGTIGNGAFSPDTSHAAVPVTIPKGATLADVAAAINRAKAGVSAYVANTGAGAQLVLKGQEGAANGFVVEASENPSDPGLRKLAWTPASTTGKLLSTAGDAAFKVDGLEMTSPSNTVTDAVPGVKLALTATTAGSSTRVTLTDTSSAITSGMSDLTSALNAIAGALNTALDPQSGDLRSDGGARDLQRRFGQLAGKTIMPNATGAAKTLADLGLSTQADGTFTLDSARLSATLAADPSGVAAMFTNGLYGVLATVDGLYRDATAVSNPGSLGGSITRYTGQLKKVTQDKSAIADQQEALRSRLSAQFTASDTHIAQYKSTLTFIQNQIAAWNSSSN